MIQKDVVMRWTQELAKVIARLLGKDPEVAIGVIQEAYIGLLGLTPNELYDVPESEFVTILEKERQLNEGQLDFLAELLYREGKYHLELQQKELAHRHLKQALLIFEHLDKKQEVYSAQRHLKMSELRGLLTI